MLKLVKDEQGRLWPEFKYSMDRYIANWADIHAGLHIDRWLWRNQVFFNEKQVTVMTNELPIPIDSGLYWVLVIVDERYRETDVGYIITDSADKPNILFFKLFWK